MLPVAVVPETVVSESVVSASTDGLISFKKWETIEALAARSATWIAFSMAFGGELPWQMIGIPFTPRRGAPPVSV